MDREWKLGKDLSCEDNAFDPISFEDLIMALQCGEKTINRISVLKVANELLLQREQDMQELIKRNLYTIIAEVKSRRGEHEQC